MREQYDDSTNSERSKTTHHTLTVFFDGTTNTINPPTTQIGTFFHSVLGIPVVGPSAVDAAMTAQPVLKMAFDGCGITNGLTGTLFASGLDGQVEEVVEVAEKMVGYGGGKVRVVAIGLSRGGIACFKLAKKLATRFPPTLSSDGTTIRRSRVSTSLLVFDPVPGNAVWTGFPYTAAFSQNLAGCHNLERVLALYPYEPLPDLAMHAPSLAVYPETAEVEEDVTLGCHQGALYGTRRCRQTAKNEYQVASNISFRRIYDFLLSEGVEMEFSYEVYIPTEEECRKMYQLALKATHGSVRKSHDKTGRSRTIVRRGGSFGEKCRYLNRHHRRLENSREEEVYQLDFEERNFFCGL